jgi:protein O-mannosyl-transferase
MKKNYTNLIVIFLVVSSCVAFGLLAFNDFVNIDDEGFITDNNHIKSGINPGSVKWAFTDVVVSNWLPLTLISHMLDWSLFGANASGHHIVSLLLHIGAVIFLFLFLNKTTNNIWSSAFAAALFALHPLRVESVAWASERKDVLSMFFGMASIYTYAYYAESPKLSKYLLCFILFALSLMAKSMLVTLPFVFLLLDYWPIKRWQKEIAEKKHSHVLGNLVWEKIPFIFLTIISSIMTIWAQYGDDSVYPPLAKRFLNAVVSYVSYLKKTFWPVDLAVYYPSEYSITLWQILVSSFFLIVITITVIYFLKKLPFLFVGWFWYLGTLIPVSGLVPVNQSIADHYTYLPSIGIAIILAWGIPPLIKNEGTRKNILFPIAFVVLAMLVVLTWKQCGYWKNSIELWNHAIKVTKDNYLAHNGRGVAYYKLGQNQKAIEDYNEAIRLNPYDDAYHNRGTAYAKISLYQKAIEDYNEAIRLKPRADTYHNRGFIYYKLGQHKRAIEDFSHAILMKPDSVMDYNHRGNAYSELGQYQKAIEDYKKAIHLKPESVMAYNNKGNAYSELGQYQKAIEDYNEAIRLYPDDFYAYYNMACCYAIQKNSRQVCHYLTLAIERGFDNWTHLKKDKDFDNIRNTACFIKLLNKSGK